MRLDNIVDINPGNNRYSIHRRATIQHAAHDETITIDVNQIAAHASIAELTEYEESIIDYFRNVHNISDRTAFYIQYPDGVPLMELFDAGVTMCRERAILMHILLAQLNISTVVISASDHSNADRHYRHAFLVSDTDRLYDPTQHFYSDNATINNNGYTAPDTHTYNQRIEFFRAVKPLSEDSFCSFRYNGETIHL